MTTRSQWWAKAIAVLMTISVSTTAQADQWTPSRLERPASTTRVNLIDSNVAVSQVSRIGIVREGVGVLSHCKSFGVAPCTIDTARSPGFRFIADILLPFCESTSSQFCVKDLATYQAGMDPTPAKYLGESVGPTITAQPEFLLPAGGGTLLFEAPTTQHAGGMRTFGVRARLFLDFDEQSAKFRFNGFDLIVQPYTERTTNTSAIRLEEINPSEPMPDGVHPNARSWRANEWRLVGDQSLAWNSGSTVGIAEDFAEDTRVRATVRIPSDAGGWFSGRLKDPVISLNPIDSMVNELTIDALSLTIPRLTADVPNDKHTPQMRALGMSPNGGGNIESGFDTGVDWVEELRPFVNDRAVGTTNVWVLRRSPVYNQPCFRNDKVGGLVTTNATAYSWNPPAFKDGFLDYKVAGLHLMPDGSVTQGTYDLILSSDVARCIYGFSKAPISATISIVGEGGENRTVATTVVSEKDGWLKLAAYGFTFSSPTVRVKLTQPEVTPAIPAVTPKAPVKKAIVCVKGKVTKKVTGTNPKCPSGFRKR